MLEGKHVDSILVFVAVEEFFDEGFEGGGDGWGDDGGEGVGLHRREEGCEEGEEGSVSGKKEKVGREGGGSRASERERWKKSWERTSEGVSAAMLGGGIGRASSATCLMVSARWEMQNRSNESQLARSPFQPCFLPPSLKLTLTRQILPSDQNALLQLVPHSLHTSGIDLVPLGGLDPALALLGSEGLSELVPRFYPVGVLLVRVLHRLEVLETLDGVGEEVGWSGSEGKGVGGRVVDSEEVAGRREEGRRGGELANLEVEEEGG